VLRRGAPAILSVNMRLGKCAGSVRESGFPMTAMSAMTGDPGDS
jgi:hypothetical protein